MAFAFAVALDNASGQPMVNLSNCTSIEEATVDATELDSTLLFFTLLDYGDNADALDALAALGFVNISEDGSIGQALEEVMTKVLECGIAWGTAKATDKRLVK